MSNKYISLIAMLVAVFFSGIYLRGEGARKREIKRELDAIRDRQEQIMSQVQEINQKTAERDQLLMNRIDSARTYIDILNAEKAHSSQKIAEYGNNIEQLQTGIDSSLVSITSSEGFSITRPQVQSSSLEIIPSGQ